jgi:DNA replication protein
MKCPIVSQDCAYGSRIARDLTSHLVGVMRGICVPVRHLDNFGKRQDTAAVKAAHFWHARGFLVLTGIPGVGKSFAAAWAVLQYLKGKVSNWIDRATWESAENAAKSVMWATAKEICDDKAVYTRACGEALLVLDDFGKEEDTRTGLAAVRNVISKRYDAKLPTIITTELTVLEIESRYGRHISERLSEDAGRGGNFYDCKGESLRLVDEKVPQ